MDLRVRFPVDDAALDALHAAAFGGAATGVPWRARLERHALTWVGAFDGETLVGFVQVAWDGGAHAFLLDTAVRPDLQGQGIGNALVARAATEAAAAGCEWLHADYEPGLAPFYAACGFRPAAAGLLRLAGPDAPRVG
ncbi:MAG TPA: GNAT family N-acetyltransferase [Frankiaceae bacterium]|nr:GNAT family N-acetyltransferase [Frankiaceae bacterium]